MYFAIHKLMLYYRYDAYEGDRVHMPIVVNCILGTIPCTPHVTCLETLIHFLP